MSEWQHDALAADLAGYLSGPELMVWTDMQLGPSGSPRPDVYTLRRSYSKPMPMAYEIKISRSDLRSDTTSGKWQSYMKYAGGVVFAVPDGLCTVADIPDGCGLIVRKAEVWRYARRPTIQHVTLPMDACMKLLIDGVSRTIKSSPINPRRVDLWQENAAIRKKFGQSVAKAARDLASVEMEVLREKEGARIRWEQVEKDIQNRATYLKSQLEKERPEWESLRTELLEWLGMSGQTSTFAVRRRLAILRSDCDADSRVEAAERKLIQARNVLKSALDNITPPEAL